MGDRWSARGDRRSVEFDMGDCAGYSSYSSAPRVCPLLYKCDRLLAPHIYVVSQLSDRISTVGADPQGNLDD